MQQGHDFTEFRFSADDGISLYGRSYGREGGSPPVFCLAGLSRNSRDFHGIAGILANRGRRVVTIDYRGRGLSDRDRDPANYNLMREARDVIQAAAHLGIGQADFIGTSRGGLILHFLPAMAPGLVRRVVLNDVGPVIEAEGLAQIRDYLSARSEPASFAAAARSLKATHGAAFAILTDADWAEMALAVFREIGGRIVPDFDPALVEPLKKMKLDQPLPELWEQFDTLRPLPLLVIRGANSTLLSADAVEAMLRRHRNAAALVAHGQGHAPLLHQPDVAQGIAAFLAAE